MRIAIMGAGNVGGGLGTALAAVGHEVVFGVRDPDSDKTRQALEVAFALSQTNGRRVGFAISPG